MEWVWAEWRRIGLPTFNLQAVSVYQYEVAFAISVLVSQNRYHDLSRRQAVRRVGCGDIQRPEQFALDHLPHKQRDN